MTETDKQIFYSAYCEYKTDKIFKQLYSKIKDLDIRDNNLFYFFKAWGSYKIDGDYISSENYIKKCETLITPEKTGEPYDIEEYLSQNKGSEELYIPFIISNDTLRNFYQLAGEVYAINGHKDKALKCYQKYQYYTEQIVDDIFRNRDSIVLYSFRKFNEYSLADLINNEITVSPPCKMNDPFDSLANIWSSEDNLNNICVNKEKSKYIPLFNKSFEYFRIRSFSANTDTYDDADEIILTKILMWSFYADEHRGFCIKYRLSKDFLKKENDTYIHNMRIIPVEYKEEYDISKKTQLDTNESYAYKYKKWTEENEVRLLSYNTKTEDYFLGEVLDNKSRIEEIIFGLRCNKKTITTIINLMKNNIEIKYSKMEMDKNNVYHLLKRNIDTAQDLAE